MSWLEPLAEQQIQLRYDYQTSRHVIHILLIQVDMVCLEDCTYVNPSGRNMNSIMNNCFMMLKYTLQTLDLQRSFLHQGLLTQK